MSLCRTRWGCVFALVCALAAELAAAETKPFDYLYIEANEGGSSGGHAAIRFGERVYHFQNREGRLVLDRETTRSFFHDYALLNNRTIHLSRVELAHADRALLLERFNRRHHAQQRQLDVLQRQAPQPAEPLGALVADLGQVVVHGTYDLLRDVEQMAAELEM